MRRTTFRLPLLAAVVALLVTAAPAAAAEDPPAPGAQARDVNVSVKIDRFDARGKRTIARGVVVASLSDLQGNKTTVREPVTVEVRAAAGGCKILTLDLDQLDLTLLGLNVHLDKVNLKVTGQRTGGVLGRLFCKLASSKVGKRTAAARAITARLQRKPMRLLSLQTSALPRVTSAQAPTPSCQVLNLIVGPLNLDLLGLVVDLNKVNLTITATRGQGALGDLFCQLADNNTSGGQTQQTQQQPRARGRRRG
jgi:hypothetical protein